MSTLLNKMLNFVGLEEEQETEIENVSPVEKTKGKMWEKAKQQSQALHGESKNRNKVVNIHSSSSLKVVVMQPQNIEDAQDVSDHLRDSKPIIVNLEGLEKEIAQRILDFLSGSVYCLDGSIQRVSSYIFLIVPNNVDVMNELKDNSISKDSVFPWVK